MRLEYENGILRVENAQGRRWQLNNAAKPPLNFEYDALFVNSERALRRLGTSVKPLSETEVREVQSFISKQAPPPSATPQRQLIADLKLFSYGLINALIAQLEYDNLLDVQITGRAESTDLYAEEARRVLAYVDTVWNAYHGLSAQIGATPEADLMTLRDYANLMPLAPAPDHFTSGPPAARPASRKKPKAAKAQPVVSEVKDDRPSPVAVEQVTFETAKLDGIINRALIIDDALPETQRAVLEQWALKTPHWMLTNSTYNEKGEAMHRIWGASYIDAYNRHGWAGMPPVLYATLAMLFRKLDVTITAPEYIGLNGQSRGQDASMHSDCELDSPDDLSILVYIGEDTDGDLVLYDKDDRTRPLHRISFRPNRVVVFDGSIPHQAFAPTDERFRMSIIVRGKYALGCALEAGGVQATANGADRS